jgi:Beta-lactamase
VHAVLVARGGKLVFERYFRGFDEIHGRRVGNVTFDADTLNDMKSVSKSVASLAVGIAIDRGLIGSVSNIAKSVFQVHGVDADGDVVFCRQLKRRYVLTFFQKLPPCLVGIEACASSHYWSRELEALGHTVRLMPPAYVKPYVKRHKNDAADAEAICEAVTRRNSASCRPRRPGSRAA